MTSAIAFSATELAPNASNAFRELGNITPDDSEAGGFAKLMRATLPDGTLVAIKRFHRHPGNAEGFAADGTAAKREFDCLCALDGANGHAPRPFALGTCTDRQGLLHHAIAMEYIEGLTVEQALGSGILSGNARTGDKTHTILRVGRHIAHAIAACDARVVHRDISPANIMLLMDAQGRVKRAVIIDWGQSISAQSSHVTPHLGEGRKLATFYFGAPCVFGGPHYSKRNEPTVDIYSFGALLYYMRLRRLPFESIATGNLLTPEVVEAIAAQKNAPLSLADAMPAMRPIERELDDIIVACTAYNPAERPTSAQVISLIDDALGIDEETQREAAPATAGADAHAAAAMPSCNSPASDENDAAPECTNDASNTSRSNSATSLFESAMNSFYGHGGQKRDAASCLSKLKKAADAGSVEAMFALGKHLSLGIGCAADEAQGANWLKRARDLGHPGAAALLRAS